MNLASLENFPPPPPGRTGWPWTVAADLHFAYEDGAWPRISIVTPSYNQGSFIEQTIRSVLLQGYPNIEYFVLDGGSTDNSVQIIRKYEPWLTGWTSEKDGGQTDAINKGWAKATGEILAWLNSDDWYYPGALAAVGRVFKEHPEVSWVAGQVDNWRGPDQPIKRHYPHPMTLAECLGRKNFGFHQPGMFWRSELIKSIGGLDLKLQYSFCLDMWAKCILRGVQPWVLSQPVACFRLHASSKSRCAKHLFMQQDWIVFGRYKDKLSTADAKEAMQWLKEYEADILRDAVYNFLARGQRRQAAQLLFQNLDLFPAVRPRKSLAGLLFRTLVTGSAPVWLAERGNANEAVSKCAPICK